MFRPKRVGSAEGNHPWMTTFPGTVHHIALTVTDLDASRAWYPIALALSSLPCAWLGARLVEHRGARVA